MSGALVVERIACFMYCKLISTAFQLFYGVDVLGGQKIGFLPISPNYYPTRSRNDGYKEQTQSRRGGGKKVFIGC
jgi:hypothetical protein